MWRKFSRGLGLLFSTKRHFHLQRLSSVCANNAAVITVCPFVPMCPSLSLHMIFALPHECAEFFLVSYLPVALVLQLHLSLSVSLSCC